MTAPGFRVEDRFRGRSGFAMSGHKTQFRIMRGGWALFLLAALFSLGAINAGLNLTYLLASLLIAVFMVALVMPALSLRGLRCKRSLADPPHAGEPFTVGLWLINGRRTTARLVAIREPLAAQSSGGGQPARLLAFAIPPGGRIRLQCTLPPFRRGVHPLPGLVLSSRFPFGVAEYAVQSAAEGELVVYPVRGRLGAEVVASLRPTGTRLGSPSRYGLRTEEFRTLREYVPGDNPRAVHWRTSARLGRLCVREFERERSAPVVVLLDSRLPRSLPSGSHARAAECVETAISFAGEVCRLAVMRGSGATLVGFFPEPRTISASPNLRSMHAIYDALARLVPSESDSAAPLRQVAQRVGIGRAWRVIAVTPVEETARGLLDAFRDVRMQVHVANAPGFERLFVPLAGRETLGQ